jgi:hypothetical protein
VTRLLDRQTRPARLTGAGRFVGFLTSWSLPAMIDVAAQPGDRS